LKKVALVSVNATYPDAMVKAQLCLLRHALFIRRPTRSPSRSCDL